jgi:hypothetical protein
VTFSPFSPEALDLEVLEKEKAAFSPCSPRLLGFEGLEREESLMYESFEQASACLK